MERKTPLYDLHVELGGRIVPFAGYLLPVQYPKGVIHEHMAVREGVGRFDVSHMGEVRFEGCLLYTSSACARRSAGGGAGTEAVSLGRLPPAAGCGRLSEKRAVLGLDSKVFFL